MAALPSDVMSSCADMRHWQSDAWNQCEFEALFVLHSLSDVLHSLSGGSLAISNGEEGVGDKELCTAACLSCNIAWAHEEGVRQEECTHLC